MRAVGALRRLAVGSAALTAVVGASALAQSTRSAEPDVAATYRIAACLVRADARRAAAFLAIAPAEPQGRLLSDFGSALGDCAADVGGEGQELRLSAPALRGPIAETLFERDFTGWSPRGGRRPVPVYSLTPPPAQVPRARLLAEMAACVVEARSAEVLALMASQPGSAAETRATQAIVPALGPCFRAGQTADVTPAQLRGLLAEAAYRRAALATGAARPTSG